MRQPSIDLDGSAQRRLHVSAGFEPASICPSPTKRRAIPASWNLAPFGNTQLNRVEALAGGADLEGAQVRVTVTGGGGRVVGALSVVDEATADPTTILLRPL